MILDEDLQLIEKYIDGKLDADGIPQLQHLLRGSSEARAKLRTLATIDVGLQDLAAGLVGAEAVVVEPFQRVGIRRKAIRGVLAVVACAAASILAVPLSTYWLSDYGLAWSGWRDSANSIIVSATLITGSSLTVFWSTMSQAGWVSYSRPFGFVSGLFLLLLMLICQATVSDQTERRMIELEELVQGNHWVSYESVFYWPEGQSQITGHPRQDPTVAQIRKELTTLRDAGFTGLYIHECRDAQVKIPSIARQLGFKAIIQGIGVADSTDLDAPETQRQIQNAISVSGEVDAYCFGSVTDREVDFLGLKSQLARLRRETKKPATTSFLHDEYIGARGTRLRTLEDFKVAALVRPWDGSSGDPKTAAKSVEEALKTFREDDIPSLLTFVFYPNAGGDGFTEVNQHTFFEEVLKLRMPRGVGIVYFSSFDSPYKKRAGETTDYTPPWEGHTGLFFTELSEDGQDVEFTPKRALKLITSRIIRQPH